MVENRFVSMRHSLVALLTFTDVKKEVTLLAIGVPMLATNDMV
jgi:hypothetical protein